MKQIYTHRPFVPITIMFCIGIIAGYYLSVPIWAWVVLAVTMLLGCMLSLSYPFGKFLILLLIFFCGAAHTKILLQANQADQLTQNLWKGQEVYIEGFVSSDPVIKHLRNIDKTIFTLTLFKPMRGEVLVNIFSAQQVSYGDSLRLKGKLSRPMNFGQGSKFSYRTYLENSGILYCLNVKKDVEIKKSGRIQGNGLVRFAYNTRQYFRRIFDKNFSENESGLVRALMLGDRTGVPYFISDIFRKTGTTHILAISGFNIAVLALMFLVILKFAPIHRNIIMTTVIVLLIFYMVMSGLSASVVRASLMASIVLLSFIIERPKDHLNVVAAAAFAALAVTPLVLFDIGFQLSFGCVIFLIILPPRIKVLTTKYWGEPKTKFGKWILEALILSFSVWIGILPAIVYYFNSISFVSIFANLLIPTMMSGAMFLAMGVMVFSFISAYVMNCFVIVLKLLLNVTIGVTFLFAQCPAGFVQIREQSLWFVGVYYLMLFFVVGILYKNE
ncbi:MAG: ComEC family competence protein [Candidatus Omnitrophica bacterium]|nr:ComEC family competence protein [Candidatus Omnitrophota bacterium]